ncbi:MAG TPA: sugar phosphate isomerase/epimerase family protein [Spirochaetia bacterium]|nr:sugar phosphate isomerase/epimerase family protein [Spirochaetia bacterium]
MAGITFSVFTKPWKDLGMSELGAFVERLGFEGIEFPLRPGYQVAPENAEKGLPELARVLGDHGVKITSVAGPTDERTFAACAKAGVPVIRIMLRLEKENYLEAEARFHRELQAMVPLCKRYGVTVGVQNHCGEFVNGGTGLRRMLEPYDPKQIAAVWDAAHIGLGGEEVELSLDLVWSHLCMVNLKNAFWRRVNGPEATVAQWEWFWTSGRQGLASWPRIARYLKEKSYRGVICLTAEYTAEDQVNRLIAEDIAFARSLL